VVARTDQQPQFWIQVSVTLTNWTLVVHRLEEGSIVRRLRDTLERLTKYSVVLPDASLTPPPNTGIEVLCTCGVDDRVCEFEANAPPLRTVFP
jgi:hypothetical protein